MAEISIEVTISDVSYQSWLRSSYLAASKVSNGVAMIESTELGVDQEDAFINYLDEAAREVLKIYSNRQGNVTGTAFEVTSTKVIYKIVEEEPALIQAPVIKENLRTDTKNAIYTYIAMSWFKLKKDQDIVDDLLVKYDKLLNNIDHYLHKLHD